MNNVPLPPLRADALPPPTISLVTNETQNSVQGSPKALSETQNAPPTEIPRRGGAK